MRLLKDVLSEREEEVLAHIAAGKTNSQIAITLYITINTVQNHVHGSWRNVGTAGQATVKSGGGAGKRATGRVACDSKNMTGWRSVIDVDVVGIIDTPGKLTTSNRDIACRHNG